MGRPVRVNGFQLPRTGDQQTVMTTYPLVTLAFDGLLLWFEYQNISTLFALFIPHLLLLIVTLSSWYMVEIINPEDMKNSCDGNQFDPGVNVICFDKSATKTRYCGTCRKYVYGLDHHCTWLNTCIGARNYVYFFALVVTGTFQMLYQSIISILYITLWRPDSPSITHSGTGLVVFITLMSIFGLICCILTIAFGVLMVFHLYLLLWIRAGTYEWMMGGRSSSNERAWSRSQKQSYETSHQSQTVSVGTEVRHGRITDSGDIVFTEIKESDVEGGDVYSNAIVEQESASGDDVSGSIVSSQDTEVLNDPEAKPEFDKDEEIETCRLDCADNDNNRHNELVNATVLAAEKTNFESGTMEISLSKYIVDDIADGEAI